MLILLITKLTSEQKSQPNWGLIIKAKRKELKETQTDFGKRFGVTQTSVSYWELNLVDPPGEVTWWIYEEGNRGQ